MYTVLKIGEHLPEQDRYTYPGTACPETAVSLQTGETTFLAVENNGMIVYLDKEEGSSPTRTTCVIGMK